MPEADVRILGTGSALPEGELLSSELEARMNLREGWIGRRTGVVARRIAASDEGCVDLAHRAAERALESAHVDARKLSQIILATSTPDHLLPPTSFDLAHRLGCEAPAFDLAGACCGFLLALEQARVTCRSSGAPVLVVAASVLSRRVAWDDPATASLFGDGAGAVVVSPERTGRFRIGVHCSRSDGAYKDAVWILAGGAHTPLDHELLESGAHLMRFGKGAAPFRRAVDLVCEVACEAVGGVSQIDHFLPHQANKRLVAMIAHRLSIPASQIHSHLDRYGNTSAASIPILLDEASRGGAFKAGECLLLAAVGSGLCASATLLEVVE
jgi:3-oxoacyl-[acyl-carrier-protein] synthase-3